MTPLHFFVNLRSQAAEECTWHALLSSFISNFSLPLVTGFTGRTPSLSSTNSESTSSAKTGTWQSSSISPVFASSEGAAHDDDTNTSASTSDECVLRRVFQMLDADGDGYVSADDLTRHLAKLGLGEDKEGVEEMVESGRGGARGGEPLDYEDFVNLYEREEEEEEEVAGAFAVFDEDGDGFISVRELQEVLVLLGFTQFHDEAFCHLIIKSVAPHLDAKIDLPHFRRMMSS